MCPMGSEVQSCVGSAEHLLPQAQRRARGLPPHLADTPQQGSADHAARPALPP